MATTALKVTATQNMLRYLVTSVDEGGGIVNIPQATLIADCAAGNLKALFTSPLTEPVPGPGSDSWAHLYKDGRLTVVLNGWGVGLIPVPSAYEFRVVSEVNELSISLQEAASVMVEIRFDHSLGR